MGCHSKNRITVYDRLAFLERIIDGLQPARELDFNSLYLRWNTAHFFEQLQQLGHITVSYNCAPVIDFIPSIAAGNRHQALALSAFISSRYAESDAVVESPHEQGGMFQATFIRTNANCVYYTTEAGSNVRFFFDPNKPSQIVY